MTKVKPRCLNCGKPLRRYRYRGDPGRPGKEWGDYGDGHFCGLHCGYQWACVMLKREAKYADALHAAMNQIMEGADK